jgi:hypothetical protein
MASSADAKKFLADEDPEGVNIQPAFKDYPYPTDRFEAVDGNTAYVPRQGQNEVGQRLFYGVTPTGGSASSTSQYGFMGIVDLPTAARYNLPVAKLVNASGVGVAPTDEALLAGYAAMKTDPNGVTKSPDFAATDPDAYPLVKVDYAMVPTTVDADRATDLKRFLTFAAGDGQENLPGGFVPMPADLVAQTNAGAAAITTGPPTTTPTTGPPTTTPLTTPIQDFNSGSGGIASGSDGGSTPSDTTAPPSPAEKPAKAKPKPDALKQSKPIVNVADAAERFGLPIVVALALLAGMYPLTRRTAPLVARSLASVRKRSTRSAPPAGESAS